MSGKSSREVRPLRRGRRHIAGSLDGDLDKLSRSVGSNILAHNAHSFEDGNSEARKKLVLIQRL